MIPLYNLDFLVELHIYSQISWDLNCIFTLYYKHFKIFLFEIMCDKKYPFLDLIKTHLKICLRLLEWWGNFDN
jgi:hypothetical protein